MQHLPDSFVCHQKIDEFKAWSHSVRKANSLNTHPFMNLAYVMMTGKWKKKIKRNFTLSANSLSQYKRKF